MMMERMLLTEIGARCPPPPPGGFCFNKSNTPCRFAQQLKRMPTHG